MDVRSKVVGPAIGMLIVAIIGGLFSLFVAVFGALQASGAIPAERSPMMGPQVMSEAAGAGVAAIACLGMAVMAVVTAFGAWRMKNLQSYGFSIAACILSIVPCYNSCCVLGIPFGIWGLIVLLNRDVRDAFMTEQQGPTP